MLRTEVDKKDKRDKTVNEIWDKSLDKQIFDYKSIKGF